jgi:hypothetical protein
MCSSVLMKETRDARSLSGELDLRVSQVTVSGRIVIFCNEFIPFVHPDTSNTWPRQTLLSLLPVSPILPHRDDHPATSKFSVQPATQPPSQPLRDFMERLLSVTRSIHPAATDRRIRVMEYDKWELDRSLPSFDKRRHVRSW